MRTQTEGEERGLNVFLAFEQLVDASFVFLLEEGRIEIQDHIWDHHRESKNKAYVETLVYGSCSHKHKPDQVADLGEGHLMADRSQISLLALHPDGLIQESEKAVFYDPLKLLDSEGLVYGLAWDEIQVRQLFVEVGIEQKRIADDAHHPGDDGEGKSKDKAEQEVVCIHGLKGMILHSNVEVKGKKGIASQQLYGIQRI